MHIIRFISWSFSFRLLVATSNVNVEIPVNTLYNTVMINGNQRQGAGSHNGTSTVNEPAIAWPAATASSLPIASDDSVEPQDWLDTPAGKEYLIKRIKEAEVYNKLHPRTYTSEEMRKIMHEHIHNYAKHKGLIK